STVSIRYGADGHVVHRRPRRHHRAGQPERDVLDHGDVPALRQPRIDRQGAASVPTTDPGGAVMKFMLFVLPTVPGTLEDRKRLRPIGRNTERYQQMLDELRKLAVLADDAGFDVMATTEHHFHSEGYEASVAPLMLYTDLAARTKRIKFSPLGMVLPSWDPIRAAE